jgi:hypothetical protein
VATKADAATAGRDANADQQQHHHPDDYALQWVLERLCSKIVVTVLAKNKEQHLALTGWRNPDLHSRTRRMT